MADGGSAKAALLACVQMLNERVTEAQAASLAESGVSGEDVQQAEDLRKVAALESGFDIRVETLDKMASSVKRVTADRARLQAELTETRKEASALRAQRVADAEQQQQREESARAAQLEAQAGIERARAEAVAGELGAAKMKSAKLSAELGKQSLQLQKQAEELLALRSEVASLAAARDAAEVVAKEAELGAAREVQAREAMEARLQNSIPRALHDQAVSALEGKVSASNARMVALDKKFKQLWADMKMENVEMRAQAEKERVEVGKERARAAREEARAKAAVQQSREQEGRIARLEQDSRKMRDLLKSVKEQSQIMRTIARIRTETDDTGGGSNTAGSRFASGGVKPDRSVGFDALVKTIDKVHDEVERQCTLSGVL